MFTGWLSAYVAVLFTLAVLYGSLVLSNLIIVNMQFLVEAHEIIVAIEDWMVWDCGNMDNINDWMAVMWWATWNILGSLGITVTTFSMGSI